MLCSVLLKWLLLVTCFEDLVVIVCSVHWKVRRMVTNARKTYEGHTTLDIRGTWMSVDDINSSTKLDSYKKIKFDRTGAAEDRLACRLVTEEN